MAELKIDGLSPMQLGRLNAALDKQYRFTDEDGSQHVRTLRQQLATLPAIKREWDGMADWSRTKFNRMNGKEQAAYEAKLKARRYYTVGGLQVPKIVHDAVMSEGAA